MATVGSWSMSYKRAACRFVSRRPGNWRYSDRICSRCTSTAIPSSSPWRSTVSKDTSTVRLWQRIDK